MRQSLFHYLFISTKQWRRSRNCWASNFVSNADQNICGGKNWSHKYYRMAYQQQQPVQRSDGGPACIQLMARIEEKIAVICNIGRSASTTYTRPGQWSGMRFVLCPTSRRTRLWRNGLNLNTYCRFLLYWHPPSSIECWLISTMAKNQLSTLCIAQDKDEGDGWKGDHYQIRTGPTDPRKCAMVELWWRHCCGPGFMNVNCRGKTRITHILLHWKSIKARSDGLTGCWDKACDCNTSESIQGDTQFGYQLQADQNICRESRNLRYLHGASW